MPFYENIFGSLEDFEDLSIKYNLEDCGMSGTYPGYHWFVDDETKINIYIVQGEHEMNKTFVCYEEGFEGDYTMDEMVALYTEVIDKTIFGAFSDWIWDMLRMGIFTEATV